MYITFVDSHLEILASHNGRLQKKNSLAGKISACTYIYLLKIPLWKNPVGKESLASAETSRAILTLGLARYRYN
jgi:hypothetical protein